MYLSGAPCESFITVLDISVTFLQVGDVEIGDIDDLEDDLAELEVAARCMPAPTKPRNMITDSKPIDIQTAMVSAKTSNTC